MHITAFGAAGAIGSLTVAELLNGGETVTAYVRNPDKIPASWGDRVRVIVGEMLGMSALTMDSGLDWTIVRFTAPNDKPGTGKLRVGSYGQNRIGFPVSRADIAAFTAAQVRDSGYIRAARPSATDTPPDRRGNTARPAILREPQTRPSTIAGPSSVAPPTAALQR